MHTYDIADIVANGILFLHQFKNPGTPYSSVYQMLVLLFRQGWCRRALCVCARGILHLTLSSGNS